MIHWLLTGVLGKSQPTVTASAALVIDVVASGTARVAVLASGSGVIPITATGAATVGVTASAAILIPITATGAARVDVRAAGNALIPITAAGAATVGVTQVQPEPRHVDGQWPVWMADGAMPAQNRTGTWGPWAVTGVY